MSICTYLRLSVAAAMVVVGRDDGISEYWRVGTPEGILVVLRRTEGDAVGIPEGIVPLTIGIPVGFVPLTVGIPVGFVPLTVGIPVGFVPLTVGIPVGVVSEAVGDELGTTDGCPVGVSGVISVFPSDGGILGVSELGWPVGGLASETSEVVGRWVG